MNIAGVDVGPDQPCRIIAEMSNNHNGSLPRAHRIIEAAKEAGADFLKTQTYTVKEICELRETDPDGPAPSDWPGWTMYDLYTKAQTPHKWFPSLIRKCEEVGIPWFSSVFGLKSLAMLEKRGCPVYKLASLDVGQDGFRKKVLATGKPVIQSSPKPVYIEGVKVMLWCPPGYPQDVNIQELHNALVVYDGLSYHGTSPQAPLNAINYGASLIEVHVQLDDEPSELEANVSLTISQLKQLVEACR